MLFVRDVSDVRWFFDISCCSSWLQSSHQETGRPLSCSTWQLVLGEPLENHSKPMPPTRPLIQITTKIHTKTSPKKQPKTSLETGKATKRQFPQTHSKAKNMKTNILPTSQVAAWWYRQGLLLQSLPHQVRDYRRQPWKVPVAPVKKQNKCP